jgi:hypothetical protein
MSKGVDEIWGYVNQCLASNQQLADLIESEQSTVHAADPGTAIPDKRRRDYESCDVWWTCGQWALFGDLP